MELGHWIAIVAVVATLVPAGITLYLRQRDKSSTTLDYQVIAQTPIAPKGVREAVEGLSVTLDERELPDPHVMKVRIANTGNRPIAKGDFSVPITIFQEGSNPISAWGVAAYPEALSGGVKITTGGEAVRVVPALMNPGEFFDLAILWESLSDEEMYIDAHFTGQTRPMSAVRERFSLEMLRYHLTASMLVVVLLFFLLGANLGIGYESQTAAGKSFISVVASVAVGLFIVGIPVVFWFEWRRYRQRRLLKPFSMVAG
ncbi:hypothetical protein [Ornithinimicrobium murale]|uniref:hypothetical protein n=1 Tax=Ornithinimicrobium murale TaxID=1050153 RepID=UPI0013B45E62|nr:hypothetical protein [Ornithinimicrobium murale]